MKKGLKELNKSGIGDIEAAVVKTREALQSAQNRMHLNKDDISLINVEKHVKEEHHKAKQMLNSVLQQKAKLSWLKCGDDNTNFFYQALKAQRSQNKIDAIVDT